MGANMARRLKMKSTADQGYRRLTVSLISTRRSSISTSQPTCRLSRPHSWRDRKCSTWPTIQSSHHHARLAKQTKLDVSSDKRQNPSTPTSNGGMPNERRVVRSKSRALVTQFTFPGRRKLQHSSKKLHRTLGRDSPMGTLSKIIDVHSHPVLAFRCL